MESTDNIVESDALVVENEGIEQQENDEIVSCQMEIRSDNGETLNEMEEQNAELMVLEDVDQPAFVPDVEEVANENNRPPRNKQYTLCTWTFGLLLLWSCPYTI